jgi:hypothetical protein
MVTLERGRTAVVSDPVLTRVCENCGEEYVEKKTTAHPLESVGECRSRRGR